MSVNPINQGGHSSGVDALQQQPNQGLGIGQNGQTQKIGSNPQDLTAQQQNLAAQGSAWNAMNGGSGSGMMSQGDMMDPSKMRLAGANGGNYFGPPNGGAALPIDLQSSGFNPSSFNSGSQMSDIINDMGLGSIMNDPKLPMHVRVVIFFMASARNKLDKDIDKLAETQMDPTTNKDTSGNSGDGKNPSQEILTAQITSDSRDKGRADDGAGAIIKSVDDFIKGSRNNLRA